MSSKPNFFYPKAASVKPIVVSTFNSKDPVKPAAYVDQLIKIVQIMAPRATRNQWNCFAIIARNIELSHEFHMGAIGHASTTASKPDSVEALTMEFAKMRLSNVNDEIQFLEKMVRVKTEEAADLEVFMRHNDEFGSDSEATDSGI